MTYGDVKKEDCEEGSEPVVIEVGDVANVVGQDVPMTVESFNDEGRVVCVWFNDQQYLQRDAFPPAILELEAR